MTFSLDRHFAGNPILFHAQVAHTLLLIHERQESSLTNCSWILPWREVAVSVRVPSLCLTNGSDTQQSALWTVCLQTY